MVASAALIFWAIAATRAEIDSGCSGGAAQDTPAKTKAAAAKTDRAKESAPESPGQERASAEALSLHYRFIERVQPDRRPESSRVAHSVQGRPGRDAKGGTREATGRA